MSDTMPLHQSVEEMAAYYIGKMRTVQPHRPYYLCGLSFGGMVAFEMARQLEAAGERIGLLLMFDAWAPGDLHTAPPVHRPVWIKGIQRLRLALGTHSENLRVSSAAAEKWIYIRRRAAWIGRRMLRQLSGRSWRREMENPAYRDLPAAFLAVRDAEQRAREAYKPGIYRGHVCLLRARFQWADIALEADLGWHAFVAGGVETITVPGTHYSLLEEPCVRVVATHIRGLLCRARSNLQSGNGQEKKTP